MPLIISKVLPAFIDPAALALILLTTGIILAFVWRRSGTPAVVFVMSGFAALLVFGSPLTAHYLMRGLEGQYSPAREYRQASAVVLLGGCTTGKIPPRIHVETSYAANRVFNAVRVLRQQREQSEAGAVPLVITGGVLDWVNDENVSEARSMFEIVSEFFGIDSADVIIEPKALNTRENALYTKAALEAAGIAPDIILVTSASHMPRSVAVFKKAGFKVTPAPTGYFAHSVFSNKPLAWLPSANALFIASVAIHEYVGIAVYKIMGWI